MPRRKKPRSNLLQANRTKARFCGPFAFPARVLKGGRALATSGHCRHTCGWFQGLRMTDSSTTATLFSELLLPFGSSRTALTLLLSGVGLALVVAGSFARNMVPLRALTLGSQVAFIASALFAPNIIA